MRTALNDVHKRRDEDERDEHDEERCGDVLALAHDHSLKQLESALHSV